MKKLYRSRRNKMLMGLCGGLSEMMNVDATLLRLLMVVLTIFSGGTVIFIYLIAGMVVPKEPPFYGEYGSYGSGGGSYNGYGGSHQGHSHYQEPHRNPYYSHNSHNQSHSQSNKWHAGYGKEEPASGGQFDSMMDDLEKKALRREIEELKAIIAKQQKGDQ